MAKGCRLPVCLATNVPYFQASVSRARNYPFAATKQSQASYFVLMTYQLMNLRKREENTQQVTRDMIMNKYRDNSVAWRTNCTSLSHVDELTIRSVRTFQTRQVLSLPPPTTSSPSISQQMIECPGDPRNVPRSDPDAVSQTLTVLSLLAVATKFGPELSYLTHVPSIVWAAIDCLGVDGTIATPTIPNLRVASLCFSQVVLASTLFVSLFDDSDPPNHEDFESPFRRLSS